MTITVARLMLAGCLLALGACTPDNDVPMTTRGSADSPMTMMVDQMRQRAAATGGDGNFGGVMRPLEAGGGQRR